MPNPKNVAQVEQIRETFRTSDVIVLTEYQGLTVAEMGDLRNKLREANVRYRVYKNTLVDVVAQELGIEGLEAYLHDTTALAMSNDLAAPAKVLRAFSSTNEKLKIKGGILGTQVIDAAGVLDLINMPSKDELRARVLVAMKAPLANLVTTLNAPMVGFVNVLNAPMRQFVTVLKAIAEKKEQADATES